MATQKKIDTVQELKDKVSKAKSIVFSDYRGMTVVQTQELKKKLKVDKGEFVVTKNTLILRSLSEAGLPVPDMILLEGPTATLFSYEDEVAPLKTLVVFAKTAGLPAIKAGIIEKMILAKDQVEAFSKLPGKDMLRAKVVGTMAAPIYGIVNVLQGNISKLVYTLSALKDKKSAQTA